MQAVPLLLMLLKRKLIAKYFKIVKEESICDKIDGTMESIYKVLNIDEKDFLPY